MSEAFSLPTALAVLAILKSHASCSSVSGPARCPLNPDIAAVGSVGNVKPRVFASVCSSAAGCQRLVLQPASLPSTSESRNLVCCDCRQSFLASELLIDQHDPGFSWQGHIAKRCYSCHQAGLPSMKRQVHQFDYGDSEAASRKRFKKAVDSGWKQHKRANMQHLQERVRVVNYNRFKKALTRMLREDDHLYRKRILSAMSAFAVRVLAAVTRASPQMQADYVQATHEWQRAYSEVAADSQSSARPEQFLQVREACVTHLLIPSHLAEFMTCVVEGINIDWICHRMTVSWLYTLRTGSSVLSAISSGALAVVKGIVPGMVLRSPFARATLSSTLTRFFASRMLRQLLPVFRIVLRFLI